MNEDFYNRHYIKVRSDNAIVEAWSDGPRPDKDTSDAICINEHGGYLFRLLVTVFYDEHGDPVHQLTEENPPIYDINGIFLYKWNGEQVLPRTEEEIAADLATISEPPPTIQEQLRADVDFLLALGGVL